MSDAGLRLRDLFFAVLRAPYDPHGLRGAALEAAKRELLDGAEALDVAPCARVQGLALSWFPTRRYKLLRFVEAERIEAGARASFARPCAGLPELAAAFVDPAELGYHDFENIVGLDRLFGELTAAHARLRKLRRIGAGVHRGRLEVSPELAQRLAQLDGLGLYAPPRDVSRGGSRFLFHSAALAAALDRALLEALPPALRRGFAHVNPVFRCNRFEPGDAPFAAHLDAPYHHAARRHVSKVTLLLYLTPGRGEAPLRFEGGAALTEIEAYTVVLFDQSLAHEGRPYDDGPKVFLRTELVYEEPALVQEPRVGSLFSRACYLDCESVFAPALAEEACRAYSRAAAAHWRGPEGREVDGPYVHKRFRGASFVTDGYDYWFHRGAFEPIDCAALALLDLLNAHVDGAPFRKLCSATVHPGRGDGRAWIAALLREQAPPPEPVFAALDPAALFPTPEEPLEGMGFPSSPDFGDPFPDDWDATRSPRVLEVYVRARQWAMRRVHGAPITMVGKELFLDPSRFVVVGDAIHVLSGEALGPVHFAGAVFFDPEDFVDVDVKLGALQPIVPPMWFREDGDILHLCCDLFRNGWMVSHRSEVVPVPRVLVGTEVEPDVAPWCRAAAISAEKLREVEPLPPPRRRR
jgi:hypothetical protein